MIVFLLLLTFGTGYGENIEKMNNKERPTHFRIINGKVISIKAVPFQVGLLLTKKSLNITEFCGGAIISPVHILTAAHCTKLATAADTLVLKGQQSFSLDSEHYDKIVKIYEHPQYDFPNYDVAILVLAQQIKTCKAVKIIKLRNSEPVQGEKVQVTGWGKTEDGINSKFLRVTELTVLARHECENAYKDIENITSLMFCAAGENTDTCQGDSGGPVIINGELVGVVSWGKECNNANYPGVYANLYSMRDFIDSSTKNMAQWV